ncbi:MAG: Cytochrome c oxidase polypeptide III, partial [uncultured Nocardioides sp.]
GQRGHDHLAVQRADVLRGPLRLVLHHPRREPRAVGPGDREAQRPVRHGQHDHPRAVLADLPARRLRRRARPGRSPGLPVQLRRVGPARVVHPHLHHGRGVHRRPGARVRRADARGHDDPRLGLRDDVLPHHRVPRPARDRRPARLPLRPRPHLRRPQVHPRAGGQRHRGVLLLALRRRGVDRAVRHDLPHPV